METGKSVRKMRKKLNMSQAKLSELTGIPQTTISGWENRYEPNIKEILKIATAFGCSLQELLNCEESGFYEEPPTGTA
jgi:transcriptional regulator with XRE-family HTH domain